MADDPVIIIDGLPCKLAWTKLTICRADGLKVWADAEGELGFERAAKFLFAMMPDERRAHFKNYEGVAAKLPPLNECWEKINTARQNAGEDLDLKNLYGSTNGPSPSSS